MIESYIIEIEGVKFYAPDKNDVIYRDMIKTQRIWEKHIIEKLCQFITPDSSVIDVGAHVGNHTIQFSKIAKTVFSFEPSPTNYAIFEANMNLNNISNVVLHKFAVSDRKRMLAFDPAKNKKRLKNSGATYFIQDDNGAISAVSLDSVFAEIDDHISLIKYDVEEMELQALQGSVQTIERFKPALYVEFIKDRKRVRSTSGEVQDFLGSIGYVPYHEEKEIWVFKN